LDLELITHRKAFRRQYKLSADDMEIAEEHISDMRDIGVVEKADSAEYNPRESRVIIT